MFAWTTRKKLTRSLGGSWAVRVKGTPLVPGESRDVSVVWMQLTFVVSPDRPSRISLINYFGNDGNLDLMELENEDDEEVRRARSPNPASAKSLLCRVSKEFLL